MRGWLSLETGLPCREVTPVVLERLKEYQAGKLPEQIVEGSPVFFDPRTGEPIVWYWASKSGEIKIFNLMGFNPENGDELNPVTKEIVGIYEEQEIKREKEEKENRPPQKIDPNTYPIL